MKNFNKKPVEEIMKLEESRSNKLQKTMPGSQLQHNKDLCNWNNNIKEP